MYDLIAILPSSLPYRLPFYRALACLHRIKIVVGNEIGAFDEFSIDYQELDADIEMTNVYDFGFLGLKWQSGVLREFFRSGRSAFFIQGNIRFINFWIVILFNSFLRKRLFVHGQGLYRFDNPGLFRRIVYSCMVIFSAYYVCYNDFVRRDLQRKMLFGKIFGGKLKVVDNLILGDANVLPGPSLGRDILFIGRVREGSSVLDFCRSLDASSLDLRLYVVGECSVDFTDYKKTEFMGPIFDSTLLSEIASNCCFGIYPGDSGLSVLHYVRLGLVPVFHSSLSKHMGPEPAYFRGADNRFRACLTFTRGNFDEAISVLKKYSNDDISLQLLRDEVHDFSLSLSRLSPVDQFSRLIHAD